MTAIVVVSTSGIETARRIATDLNAPLHGRPDGTDVPVANFGDHLRRLFVEGAPIVFVGALGALVRLLAPVGEALPYYALFGWAPGAGLGPGDR